ncbi:hypothetical protein E2C01_066144 [Portunus trituberculatus]|uniref:Uncharacterized protein n=1 Tax=Portunus trituberculatus TaxID=210409 RepID=A0A5B7HTQ4_PORTR|nr:hypothetical protein [Portunus trituberculatus]
MLMAPPCQCFHPRHPRHHYHHYHDRRLRHPSQPFATAGIVVSPRDRRHSTRVMVVSQALEKMLFEEEY